MENVGELHRMIAKYNTELCQWKTKYETDAIQRNEELEKEKKKLVVKLQEADDTVEAIQSKYTLLEKTKARQAGEIESLTLDMEKATHTISIYEKKQRNFDRATAELQQNLQEKSAELEQLQRESRALSTELFKTKNAYEECLDCLETVKKENKNLQEEISDLTDNLADTAKSLYDVEKSKKSTDKEKSELHAALEEAESAIEAEEAKVLRLQVELAQSKQDFDRRVSEKDSEIDKSRQSGQKAIESMQTTLDGEIRARAEAIRAKKKVESEFCDLEIHLANANKQYMEMQKIANNSVAENKGLQKEIEEISRSREELAEQLSSAERCSNLYQVIGFYCPKRKL